jgi:hypothetical protein
MDLPVEIRHMIFQHVLGSAIYPDTRKSSVVLAPGKMDFRYRYCVGLDPDADGSVFTNCQVSPYSGFTGYRAYHKGDARYVKSPLAFGPTLPNYSVSLSAGQYLLRRHVQVGKGHGSTT